MGGERVSIRFQILEAVKAALATMSVANGFNFNYDRVEHFDFRELEKDASPFVRIAWREAKEFGVDPRMEVKLLIFATVWTTHDYAANNFSTSQLVSMHAADLEKALGPGGTDKTWGGLANLSTVTAIDPIEPDDGWVGAQLTLEVVYEHRYDDPGVLA